MIGARVRPLPPPIGVLVLLLALAAAPPSAPPVLALEGVAADDDPDKEYFRREIVIFETFDRRLDAGKALTLKFRLHRGYRGPILVVVYPDGASEYLPATPALGVEVRNGENSYEVSFRTDPGGGVHRVALIVDTDSGEVTGARFLVRGPTREGKAIDRDVEMPPEDTVYRRIRPDEDPLRLERILFHRMNGFRRKSGAKPLPWHEGVAKCAREHMPVVAQIYEDTYDPKKGHGESLHRRPGGPTIADRVRLNLGWTVVVAKFAQTDPVTGRGTPNYVSEILTGATTSLDQKFEQSLLRLSDFRKPMMDPFPTHAAGACVFRTYLRSGANPPKEPAAGGAAGGAVPAVSGGGGAAEAVGRNPGPAPGQPPQVLAALVFVQVNDPEAADSDRKVKDSVMGELAQAGDDPERRARALRRLGQYAYAEGLPPLRRAARDARPKVAAAGLDGLWLAAPAEARTETTALEVRVLRAFEKEDFAAVAPVLDALGGVRYDAETRQRAVDTVRKIRALARERVNAASRASAEKRWAEAKAGYEAAVRSFRGFPEAEEAADGLQVLLADPAAKDSLK